MIIYLNIFSKANSSLILNAAETLIYRNYVYIHMEKSISCGGN